MKHLVALLLVAAFAVAGCAHRSADSGWVTLIDGEKGLEHFNRIGTPIGVPRAERSAPDKGKGGHLVTKNAYKDFEIYAEFWADTTTNSGIFLRAANPKSIGSASSYAGQHLRSATRSGVRNRNRRLCASAGACRLQGWR